MRLGDYTVLATTIIASPSGQGDYLFDSAVQAQVANADFVMVRFATTQLDTGIYELNSNANFVKFDCQGDAGSGTMVAATGGTSNPKNCVWYLFGNNVLTLPISLFGSADATRTGRIISFTTLGNVAFTLCAWNASSTP